MDTRKCFKLITPEMITDDILKELNMTHEDFDAKMVMFTVTKAASWVVGPDKHPLFYLKFPVKTPCVVRSDAWFETHKQAIVAAADADLEARHKIAPFDKFFPYFNGQSRNFLFYQMKDVYTKLAASGNTIIQVSNGCCTNATNCYFSQYQRFLLKAMRREYKDDTEGNTRETTDGL